MIPSRIVEAFQSYLAIRKKLENVAEIVIDDLDEYDIREIADTFRVSFGDLHRKIDCKISKNTFLETKNAFEAAVSEYRHPRLLPAGTSLSQIANHYGIDRVVLYNEILKFPNPEIPYEYDRYILTIRKIFTYKEETSILNQLIVWKYTSNMFINICVCSICTICQLLQLADQSIQLKAQLFQREYYRSKVQWLKEFEMKYHDEIITSGLF